MSASFWQSHDILGKNQEIKKYASILRQFDTFKTPSINVYGNDYIFIIIFARLGMSVTTQGGSGRQCVTGPRRNLSKYRFVLLNVYRFRET